MPVKSPVSTTAKATTPRKRRTRKTSTKKPVVKVTTVRTLKTVKRPSTARLISPQKYLKDISTRWDIHNYEITMLISDLTKGFNAVKPYHAQLVKMVNK